MRNSTFFTRLAYLYLGLPIFIFITGWGNLFVAIIGGLIVCASLYFACKNAPALWFPVNKTQRIRTLILLLLALIWVYISGIGGFVFQNSDHNCRNPLFELLVQSSWPVSLNDPPVILTYYIGFWLPSALVGKLFHSVQLGFYAQLIWATLGIFLVFYLIWAYCKQKKYWVIFLFILFSGLDVLGCLLSFKTELLYSAFSHLEWYYPKFQFSSLTTQLFWVFNQALPIWVAVLLMIHEKNNKNLLFIYASTFLHSTLPAIGLFPFVVYWYIKNGTTYTYLKTALINIKKTILQSLTFQNVIGTAAIMLISFSYLSNNISGAKRDLTPLWDLSMLLDWIVKFFLPEVGFYLILIWKHHKRNMIFYLCLVCFLVYPFIRVGARFDFCMRATIPALVLLYLMVIKTLENEKWRIKNRFLLCLLMLTLAVGSITPLHEIIRTVYGTMLGYRKPEPNLSIENFFGWKEKNLFLHYFGKTPID